MKTAEISLLTDSILSFDFAQKWSALAGHSYSTRKDLPFKCMVYLLTEAKNLPFKGCNTIYPLEKKKMVFWITMIRIIYEYDGNLNSYLNAMMLKSTK